MATFDNLNAPQFSTFDDSDLEEVETYFQIDHESNYNNVNKPVIFEQSFEENFYSPMTKIPTPPSVMSSTTKDVLELRNRKIKRSWNTENESLPNNSHHSENTDSNVGNNAHIENEELVTVSQSSLTVIDVVKHIQGHTPKIKRSLSSGSIAASIEHLERSLAETSLNKETTNTNKSFVPRKEKFVYGKLRKASSSSQSRLKYCSQENINRLAAPKRFHSSNGNIAQSSNDHVSLAEAVKKFQEKTPIRYHSRNRHEIHQNGIPTKLRATIPQSPKLLTKKRVKNTEHVLSHEERERLEVEEAKKFKIKAHPVNKKIFKQPLKAIHVEKKPATVPDPFKLTKVENKKIASSPKKDEYRFHAKPMPKYVLQPPKLPEKQPALVTLPVTPTFVRKIPQPSPVKKSAEKVRSSPLKNTKPAPFSFEKRDQTMLRKREEHIKKVVEEEKKAREFHARPIPSTVASMINKQKQQSLNGSGSSSTHGESTITNGSLHEEHFKAKPATVLYQKPFEPKKLDHPLTEIQPFQLYSEMRARERENFERKKREQEEKAAEMLRLEEEERLRREQEEIQKLRKNIIFKAHPIRNFKEVVIKPSGKVTEPISPVFRSGKSNKENVK